MGTTWVDILGYVASVLVAISLTMRSLLRLRLVNLVGAVCFATYGVLLRAWPVALVNGIIVIINLWHLAQSRRPRELFRLLQVQPTSEYLAAFLAFHADDIREFLPGFNGTSQPGQMCFFVLRDMVPAGLFMAQRDGEAGLRVELDYVIPNYRDFLVGPFLFAENADLFRAQGIREIWSDRGNDAHAAYLRRMGFTPEGGAADAPKYCLAL